MIRYNSYQLGPAVPQTASGRIAVADRCAHGGEGPRVPGWRDPGRRRAARLSRSRGAGAGRSGNGDRLHGRRLSRQRAPIIVGSATEAYDADLIVKVKEPQRQELPLIRAGSTLFCYLHLAADPELATALLASGATCIAYETVTAQGELPLLVPMSQVAGRLSIQVGAAALTLANGGGGCSCPEYRECHRQESSSSAAARSAQTQRG